MSEEERELLERARQGDIDAFAAFVRHFERRVRSVLYRMLDDQRDVEEATQDTFLQAWRSLQRFRGDAAPFTWLYRIAANEALMRRRRHRVETIELTEAHAPVEESGLEAGELRAVLIEHIRALPFEYRAALVLRDVEGLSNADVALVLGISVAAAKSRIHRARMSIRASLAPTESLSD